MIDLSKYYNLCVIGADSGGLELALAAAVQGVKTVLIEPRPLATNKNKTKINSKKSDAASWRDRMAAYLWRFFRFLRGELSLFTQLERRLSCPM